MGGNDREKMTKREGNVPCPLYTNKFNVSRCFLFIFRGRGWPNIYLF